MKNWTDGASVELGQDLKVGWGQVGGSRKEGKGYGLALVQESREEWKREMSPLPFFALFLYLLPTLLSVDEKLGSLVSKP